MMNETENKLFDVQSYVRVSYGFTCWCGKGMVGFDSLEEVNEGWRDHCKRASHDSEIARAGFSIGQQEG